MIFWGTVFLFNVGVFLIVNFWWGFGNQLFGRKEGVTCVYVLVENFSRIIAQEIFYFIFF